MDLKSLWRTVSFSSCPDRVAWALCAALGVLLMGGGVAIGASRAVTVYDTVLQAFAYNPGLKVSQEERQGKVYDVDRARAGYYPKVSAYSGVGLVQGNNPASRARHESSEAQGTADAALRLVQPLWYGGATTADVAVRGARLDAADSMLEDTANSLAFDAVLAHTEVLRRREMLRLARTNVAEHTRIFALVRQRFQQNIATAGEMYQIEGRLARAKATMLSYGASLEAAEANYLRVTGQAPPADLAPSPEARVGFDDPQKVREACVAAHPRLSAALAEIRAARGERDMAKSNFWPKFDLEAGPGWYDRHSKDDVHEAGMDTMLRMRWEFYSGGADTAAVRMGGARIRQARQYMHAVMDMLNEDIESTYSRWRAAAEEVKEYGAAHKAAALSSKDFEVQFAAGQRSLIDVLDAVNDMFFAASQQAVSGGDRVISGYRLLGLSGGLLGELDIAPAALRDAGPTTQEDGVDPRFAAWSTLIRQQKPGAAQK